MLFLLRLPKRIGIYIPEYLTFNNMCFGSHDKDYYTQMVSGPILSEILVKFRES